jgi:hypothetical protein
MRRSLRWLATFVLILSAAVVVWASASYPSATKSFSTHLAGQVIASADINAIQDEIIAIENGLRTGLAHNLLPDGDITRSFGTNGFRWLHPSGTVTAPGVAVGATGVGVYSSGTNALELATNGTKALGIDSTQFIDSPTQPRARVYNNATLSIADSTATVIAWNSERYDVGAMHDTAVNNSRITVPTGGDGLYLFTGEYGFNANATGYRLVTLRKNGTTTVASVSYTAVGAGTGTAINLSAILDLVATDYIEVIATQTSTGNLTSGSTSDDTAWFSAVKLW